MVSTTSEILLETERILASRWLRESQQLQALLRYIVLETLAGRSDGLKEYSLGREVFHRPPDYDPRNDAIVRVQASLLRKRLAAYYEEAGRESSLRISLPRGGYVPAFEVAPPPPSSPLPPLLETPPPPRHPKFYSLAAALLAGVLLGAVGLFLWQSRAQPGPVPCPQLWQAFLDTPAETVVSFGVPLFFSGGGGLYVRDTQVNQLTDDPARIQRISEILGRTFRPQGDVYTGIGDAIGTYSIARWLEGRGVQARVGNSNYIGRADIEGKHLVVVASARFQTLLQQMNLPHKIRFTPNRDAGGFELLDPAQGETDFYRPSDSPGLATSYAVVSLWPSRDGKFRRMYVSGIETWSTQGAAQYVLDDTQLEDLRRRLESDPPSSFRGRKSPYFQLLLRIEGKNNLVHSAMYVTHRYLPPTITPLP